MKEGFKKLMQNEYVVLALVVAILAIVFYFYNKYKNYKAEQAEINAIIDNYEKNKDVNVQVANRLGLSESQVALAKDIAFNVSIAFESNKELTWWQRNKDNALKWAMFGVGALLYGGVPSRNKQDAVRWLNRIQSQSIANAVQSLYESDYTMGRNLKIDLDSLYSVQERNQIRSYRFLN